MDTDLEAVNDVSEARRLLAVDRRADPVRLADELPDRDAYSPGVSVRADAPVDLLMRLACEDPLHALAGGATLELPVSRAASGGAAGLMAVVEKCLRAGQASAVEFRTW